MTFRKATSKWQANLLLCFTRVKIKGPVGIQRTPFLNDSFITLWNIYYSTFLDAIQPLVIQQIHTGCILCIKHCSRYWDPANIQKYPILDEILGKKHGVRKNKSGMGNMKWGGRWCTCLDRGRLPGHMFEQSSEVGEGRALGIHLKSFPNKGSSKNSWLL